MGTGLSNRQRQVLALLSVARRPLTSDELLELSGRETTAQERSSMLRTLRRLEERGLARLERLPARGHGRIAATANPGAAGELSGADLHRARRQGAR